MQTPLLPALLGLALVTTNAFAGLASYYPFDESANDLGSTTAEFIEGNDAATIGFDPDPLGSFITRGHPAARPDLGTSYLLTKGGGFDLGGAAAVQPADKFTLTWWMQPTEFDAFDRIYESLVGNDNSQHGLRIDTGGGAGNRLRCLVRDGNGGNNQNATNPLVMRNDGTWYFCAFRYDSAGIDNRAFQITVIESDGSPIDAAAITAGTSGPATSNVGAMQFPHAANPNTLIGLENADATGGNNLAAALDELAFFDNSDGGGVLTDAQLADVFNFGPSGVDLITSFESNLSSVAPDDPVTLSWEVAATLDSLILDDGDGEITDVLPLTTAGEGSLVVNPEVTTTYYLRATHNGASNVSVVTILAGAAPVIDSFSTSQNVVQTGGSVDLSWTTTGADTITLDPGATDVSALTTTSVSPAETTTYTLTAANGFGSSNRQVTVQVIDGPVPTHRYVAATAGNTDGTWLDEIDTRNWGLTGATLDMPLITPSANTNIAAAYSTAGGVMGGSAGAYQYGEFTAEIWLRPTGLTTDHQVIFETGGGQNGLAALMTATEFRFIGSAVNTRNVDFTIPIGDLNISDFVQLVITNDSANDVFEVAIRDTFGNVLTASEVGNVTMGGNSAGLFIHASGILGGEFNLGGRTELPDTTPEGLTGFTGEIGIVNIYSRILTPADIQAAFDAVATTVDPPSDTPFAITEVIRDANALTVTWDSIDQHLYDAETSTDGETWTPVNDTIQALGPQTTKAFTVPPGEDVLLLRIVDLGED